MWLDFAYQGSNENILQRKQLKKSASEGPFSIFLNILVPFWFLILDCYMVYPRAIHIPNRQKESQFSGKRTILLAYLSREKTWKFKTNLVLLDTLIDIVL